MLRGPRVVAFLGLALTSSALLLAQNSQVYSRAVAEYNAGDFASSCTDLRSLYDNTTRFRNLPSDVVAAEKSAGVTAPQWTHKAILSDQHERWAQECAEYMREGLNFAAFDDFYLVDDARNYADRAIAHPGALPSSATTSEAAPPPAPSRPLARRPPAAAYTSQRTPAPANTPSGSDGSLNSGSGNLPDGDYKCYTATTATILAGGSAQLNPGQFLTHIHVKGNTYQAYEDPAGHYSVGPNGKITWNGGTYSSKTLGRYVIDHGEPAIVIGYADTDAGSVCKR